MKITECTICGKMLNGNDLCHQCFIADKKELKKREKLNKLNNKKHEKNKTKNSNVGSLIIGCILLGVSA